MRMILWVALLACVVPVSCQSPATKSAARVPASRTGAARAPGPSELPIGPDSAAGVAYVTEYDGFSVVFNHGHFVGVVYNFNNQVRAYRYVPGDMAMHPSGANFRSVRAAARFLGSPEEPKQK